ncbi:MAG: protein kinase [Xanthomonadales bacterium]|nr:protein kinase [Xanthomonadales bacterium]
MRPDRPDIAGYRILRRLGHGGMSEIWLAEQVALARPVAVKVVNPGDEGEERLARFRQEAAIVARFDHPNVVGILEFGQTADGRLFFSMPYVPGGTLAQAALCGDGPRTRQVLVQLLDALEYIHAHGVVHRDVKPENVLFDSVGRARLADFGVSRSVSAASRHTRAGETLGSIHYMSPEQARGELPDGRSDLYSLGAIAFELLTGAPPFQGPDDISVVVGHLQSPLPELPEQLGQWQRWLARALAKRPADRFPDAAAMRDALNRVPGTPRPPLLSPRAREAVLRAGLPALAVLVLGVASGWLWLGRGEEGAAEGQAASPEAALVQAASSVAAPGPAQADAATPGGLAGDPGAGGDGRRGGERSGPDGEPVADVAPGQGSEPGSDAPGPVPTPERAVLDAPMHDPQGPSARPRSQVQTGPSRMPGADTGSARRVDADGSGAPGGRVAAPPPALPQIGGFDQVPPIPLLLLSGTREQQISRLEAWLDHGRQVMDADRSAVALARRASGDRQERARLQAGLDHRRANYEDWRRQVLALRRQVERRG